jgi:hypothetical protein
MNGEKMFNPLDLKNRRYLVTGAASGMGRAITIDGGFTAQ